jgi:hypothetical protein
MAGSWLLPPVKNYKRELEIPTKYSIAQLLWFGNFSKCAKGADLDYLFADAATNGRINKNRVDFNSSLCII